jgi:hypothetical protein
VLQDGRIYFVAGVWPFEGAFLCSFDAESNIRIHEDLLIVPVFGVVEEFGDVPVKMVAMDRHSGQVIWSKQSDYSFPFVAVD